WFNFTALNTPEDHPARSMHDTFYVEEPGGGQPAQGGGQGHGVRQRGWRSPGRWRRTGSGRPCSSSRCGWCRRIA
ncbi:hypothetical protein C8238_02705, partial [Paracidovorax avenae]